MSLVRNLHVLHDQSNAEYEASQLPVSCSISKKHEAAWLAWYNRHRQTESFLARLKSEMTAGGIEEYRLPLGKRQKTPIF